MCADLCNCIVKLGKMQDSTALKPLKLRISKRCSKPLAMKLFFLGAYTSSNIVGSNVSVKKMGIRWSHPSISTKDKQFYDE